MITFKKIIYSVLIALLAAFSPNFGVENNENNNISVSVKKTDLELFLEKFAPPKELRDLIEKNKKNLKFGYILKGETASWICKDKGPRAINRIINAWRCNKLIEKYQLDRLKVPLKYAYEINGDVYVFAEFIKFEKKSEKNILTNEEIRQIAFFAHQSGFFDWLVTNATQIGPNKLEHHHNIIQSDKKLIIIDTENMSFGIDINLTSYGFKNEVSRKFYNDYMENAHTRNKFRDTKLKEWLEKYDNLREKKIIKPSLEIPINIEFDDLGIDFKKMKEQLTEKEQIKSKL